MITDISDNDETAKRICDWVLTNLDASVPTHFVRFHPDYKMRDTIRTPVDRLESAREVALSMGLEHVYLGNVYDTKWSNTYCRGCDALLVTRYGLNAQILNLDASGCCRTCGRNAHFRLLPSREVSQHTTNTLPAGCDTLRSFEWHGDIRSVHVQVLNPTDYTIPVCERRLMPDGTSAAWNIINLRPGESFRFIIAKSSTGEFGCEVALPSVAKSNLHEVFDRAHFPTVAIEDSVSPTDISPLPMFQGRQTLRVATAGAEA